MVTKRVRKPSQQVQDIIEGKGPIPKGVQLPTPDTIAEERTHFVGEGAAEQLMAILEYKDDTAELSLALVEFTAEAEVLEPTSLAEAKRRPDWALWEGGIREELTTLTTAGTWELVDPPTGANIVRSKWVFSVHSNCSGLGCMTRLRDTPDPHQRCLPKR